MANQFKNLPQHKAPDTIWQSVNGALNNQQALKSAIASLPKHAAPKSSWGVISRQITPIYRLLPLLARVAAILILLIGLLWVFNIENNEFRNEQQYVARENHPAPSMLTNTADVKIDTIKQEKKEVLPDSKKVPTNKKVKAPKTKQRRQKNYEGLHILPMNTIHDLLGNAPTHEEVFPSFETKPNKKSPQIARVKLIVYDKPQVITPAAKQRRFKFSFFDNWRNRYQSSIDTSYQHYQPMLVARLNNK